MSDVDEPQLLGSDDVAMEPSKLARIEDPVWNPPCLTFLEKDYLPIGDGLAIPADPLEARLGDDELRGLVLEFGLREGRLACVAVRSGEGGPALTSALLRRVEPVLREVGRDLFERSVVRLIELDDGSVAGELAWQRGSRGVAFGRLADEAAAVFEWTGRTGRPSLSDAHLERVADLYREAERQGVPRTEFISRQFPNQSPGAIRNWVRQARLRGKLAPAPERRGG